MTKMAAMPYIVKTLKYILLRNQKADDLETWYAALGALVLPSFFKWWRWVDLTYFTARQIWSLMILYGEKDKTIDFSEINVVYDVKFGISS